MFKVDLWTEEENEILRKFYPDSSYEKICELLPGRTKSAIIAKASKMKIRKNVPVWTKEQYKILKKYYPSSISNRELLDMLPNHSFYAIKTKAKLMKIRRGEYLPTSKEETVRRWTKDEIDVLTHYYDIISDKELLQLLPGRTIMAIKHLSRKMELGTKKVAPNFSAHWTTTEDSFLIDNFSVLPNDELLKFLSGRTLVAIKARAQKLGLKRGKNVWSNSKAYAPWSEEDVEYLKSNWNKISVEEICKKLYYRSEIAIHKQSRKMGLPYYEKAKFDGKKRRTNQYYN